MKKGNVVITGAGSGLGQALAQQYSAEGYHICLLGRNTDKLKEVGQTLQSDYMVYSVDIANNQQVQQVFLNISKDVGPIDILLNNAGTGTFDLAEKLQEDSIHQMIDVNLKGTIFCTQAVLDEMKERNSGIIANTISTAGLEGKVTESVYCASKFGVRGFTESLALELKNSNIHVCGAYMGGMRTEFWNGIHQKEDIKHLMDPNDVAEIMIHNLKSRKGLSVSDIVIKNKV